MWGQFGTLEPLPLYSFQAKYVEKIMAKTVTGKNEIALYRQ